MRDSRTRTTLKTFRAVVAALGGRDAVRAMTDASPQSFSNWARLGRFPAAEYDHMTRKLKRARLRAPPSLWGQRNGHAKKKRSR